MVVAGLLTRFRRLFGLPTTPAGIAVTFLLRLRNLLKLTAAGLSGTLTRFPLSALAGEPKPAAKIQLFRDMAKCFLTLLKNAQVA